MRQLDPPVQPDAEQARQWALDELSKRQYQDAKPGLGDQILRSIADFFKSLLDGLSNALHVDTGIAGLVIVLVLLAIIGLIIFLIRPRLLKRQNADSEVFETETQLSAEEHRRRAARAATAGNYDNAVTEVFRAIVRAAEERVVLDPQPGRTADEVTAKLAAAFAAEAPALWPTALLFNRIRYSARKSSQGIATEADYLELLRLDRALLELRPADESTSQLEWVGPR